MMVGNTATAVKAWTDLGAQGVFDTAPKAPSAPPAGIIGSQGKRAPATPQAAPAKRSPWETTAEDGGVETRPLSTTDPAGQ